MASKIMARGKLGDFDIEATAVNPGAWFGETWLIECGLGYSSAYYVVEAGNESDAIDVFADSEFSHHIDLSPEDAQERGEDNCHYAGNDGHPVDLDNVMLYGRIPSRGFHRPEFICRYHGDGLPESGIDPAKLDDWPLDRNGDTFSVVEHSSFFAVRHGPSGAEHPMGEGVDTLFDDDDQPISPGIDGFCERWAEALNENESETLEAYFPEFHAID